MKKTFAALLLITCVFAVRPASAQNLLVNGGFEAPAQGPPLFATFNIPAGSTYITGWNVVQGNVDLTTTANYGPGPNTLDPTSVQDIDLVGDTNGSGGVFGGLSQAFATVTGQQYQLTFHFSHNNGTFSPDYAAQVTVADANAPANTVLSEEVSQAFIGSGFGIPVWESFSQTFIANSDLTLLTFINTRGAFNAGIYLDNASVIAGTAPTPTPTPIPCSDSWTATDTTSAPAGRFFHTSVWTGTEMIVWGGEGSGGYLKTGGRYNPVTGTWIAISTTNAPAGREYHTAVWTGTEMIVWGGEGIDGSFGIFNTGGRYNPATDTWTAISTTNAPSGRDAHTAVWTGTEMIVWGGYNNSGDLNTGGRYNPVTDTWTASSTTNAPTARDSHAAVWNGTEMIVWGGFGGGHLNTGGRYNPVTNTWTAISTTNAPAGRSYHTAIWSGSEMIVWGGFNGGYVNTGGRYNPVTDTWTAISTTNAPSARYYHTAVWAGSEMVVWGGADNSGRLNTGGRYNPVTGIWTATAATNAPTARFAHTAVWTGSEMIVWGGSGGGDTGGRWHCGQPPDNIEFLNVSGRLLVQTGDKVGIAGFIVKGSGFKRFIARATGTSMKVNGTPVAGRLMDPVLELHDSNGQVITNDNWRDGGQEAEIQASGLAPSDDREAAIIRTVPAGNYTAVIRGANNTTGIGLIEVYDLGPITNAVEEETRIEQPNEAEAVMEVANLSIRAEVLTGDNVLIVGIILRGDNQQRALFRALGPSVQSGGQPVPGTMADPTLELYDGNGVLLRSNDDWQQAPNASEIQATGLAPSDPKESAILLSLTAGNYTTILRGKNNTTGIALSEVYELDN